MTKRAQAPDRHYLIYLILIAATLAVYWQVAGFDFINTDDGVYVADNQHVLSGLNVRDIRWAFSSNNAANWHPVTWLSLMTDHEISSMLSGQNANRGEESARVYHLTNLLLHLVSTLLLFYILSILTGYHWRSGLVALLFAIHPLHVESVAWVAERKDVLSALFLMLTMLAYVRYAKSPSARRYLLVVAAFVLGLMAKPMIVSLPIILLLIDFWPLQRSSIGWRRLVLEKSPLLMCSAASCAVTIWAQSSGQAVASLTQYPMGVRAANAAVATVSYIIKMISPLNLAMFYPHPGNMLPVWQVIGSVLLLISLTAIAVWQARRRPYFIIGWLWYLITLIPVVGLMQVGMQAMADRYTYIPLIGPFIAIVWLIPDVPVLKDLFFEPRSPLRGLGRVAAAGIMIGLMVLTFFQVSYWRNSFVLAEHAINTTENNYFAHNNLGAALVKKGQIKEGIAEYLTAIHYKPDFADARYNLGIALARIGRLDAAEVQYREVARMDPRRAEIFNNMGAVFAQQGKFDEAFRAFSHALELDPSHVKTLNNLGCLVAQQGKLKEAAGYFRRALEIDPGSEEARQNLDQAEQQGGVR